MLPLKSRVNYQGYETVVVGYDSDGWVMILVTNYMKHPDGGPLNSEEIASYSGDPTKIDSEYIGQRGKWLTPDEAKQLQLLPEVPKGPDGCACIRCTKFCEMSQPNLMKTDELENRNIPPSKVKKAFACWSCRDTVGWWIRAQGWTYTGPMG